MRRSHQRDTPWGPILTGELDERAQEAVQAIADRLDEMPADWVPDDLPEPLQDGAKNNASLAGGRAGLAVFYGYLAQAWSRERDRRRAGQLLEEAIDLMAGAKLLPSFYAGFTGVAWAAEHLQRGLLDPDEEDDPNDAIDEVLLDYLDRSPWRGEYDLVNGLVGFGVYALERLPREPAIQCLERIIDRLDEMAERGSSGTTWLSVPELLPPHQREQSPRGHYNLGVAHGVPAVIALLGGACAAGVARRKARTLLESAVAWLLAQRLSGEFESRFPRWVGPDTEPATSRLAWCYGDPGVAATLLNAARCVDEPTWKREAVEIARTAARRRSEDPGVIDAGLCHGAAGLGHLFNRMYHGTGDAQLAEAARFWFQRALEVRRLGEGIGGFLARLSTIDGEEAWVADPHFLTGAAGVGLALLAATTSIEPAWDRIMLVSVPSLA